MAPPGNGHGRVEKDGPERGLGLDLARALAVMMVLVGHWANNVGQWFHVTAPHKVSFAGQMGVELFFALSGFLIGRILLDIIDTRPEWRDFRVFMIRRAMRTLPLYFLWLALLLLVFPPRQDGLAVALRFLTLTQNLTAPMPPDYYTVTWSLTVEEWFYLLFGGGLILGARLLGGARKPAGDVEPLDDTAGLTGLLSDEGRAQHLFGEQFHLVDRLGEADAALVAGLGFLEAALAAAAGMDLRLHDPHRAWQFLRRINGFRRREGRKTLAGRHAVLAVEFFRLVLVDVHGGRSGFRTVMRCAPFSLPARRWLVEERRASPLALPTRA